MTVEWFDLGQRLWAERHHRPAQRVEHRLVADPAVHPVVAVRATSNSRGECEVSAACGPDRGWTVRGASALRRFDTEGLSTDSAVMPVLVVEHLGSVRALAHLARRHADAADVAVRSGAAVVGFWADRADDPTSGAVIVLPEASTRRWVLGTSPDEDRQCDVWRSWLDIADPHPTGMLSWAQRLAEGPELAYLADIHALDHRSWDRWRRIGDGWTRPASVAGAAMDLRSRTNAADLMSAGLLTDRLWRRRAVHSGEVITGTCIDDGTSMVVAAARSDGRLRRGNPVIGWAGTIDDMPFDRFSGDVTATSMSGEGLRIRVTVSQRHRPGVGDPIVLMPAPPIPARLGAGRGQYWSLFARRGSWLSTGTKPVPQRRDVPLDILIAGAETPHGDADQP